MNFPLGTIFVASYRFWGIVICHLFLAVVQSLSHVCLFATSWTTACQAPLSSTISQSLLKFMSIKLVMLSNHLILCHPLLLLPSIFPNIKVFSNESVLHIRWTKYWRFNCSISPSNDSLELISFSLLTLDFICSSFYNSFKYKVRLRFFLFLEVGLYWHKHLS